MDRYSRLLELSDFSKEKLLLLQSKKVLIIGAGGVGQTVSTYLATNGVINLKIVDFDKVEISNLNRQILVSENDIGKYKVDVVKEALLSRNSTSNIETFNIKVTKDNLDSLLSGVDLVIDAVDNWESKLVISDACKTKQIPFMHVGVDGHKGQYCLFKNKSLKDLVDINVISSPRDGVTGPMVGTVSSLAASYVLDFLTGDNLETDKLYFYDHKSKHLGKVNL